MTRQLHIATALGSSKLRVSIIDDNREKLYYPGIASASRLDRILKEVKSHTIIIDSLGPSIIYDAPKQAVYPPPQG